MPIYEYKCLHCQYQFERIIMDRQPEPTACPNCKSAIKKVPTAGSFRWAEFMNHPNEPDVVQEAARKRKERNTILKGG